MRRREFITLVGGATLVGRFPGAWPQPKSRGRLSHRIFHSHKRRETMRPLGSPRWTQCLQCSGLALARGLSSFLVYMQDYGGPGGVRMVLAHPDRIEGLIAQNAVAHNGGLGAIWKPRRAFWADRAANESTLRTNFLSLETTRGRHIGSYPNVDRYDPYLWTDQFAVLGKPGQA